MKIQEEGWLGRWDANTVKIHKYRNENTGEGVGCKYRCVKIHKYRNKNTGVEVGCWEANMNA